MTTIAVTNMIKDNYTLSQKAQIVLDFLGRVSNNKTYESFYSQKTMAERLHISYSSIQRAIRELKALGLLIIKPRFDMDHNGRQTSNLYTIVSEEELQELLREEKRKHDEECARSTEMLPEERPEPRKMLQESVNEQMKIDLTECSNAICEDETQTETNNLKLKQNRYMKIRKDGCRELLSQIPITYIHRKSKQRIRVGWSILIPKPIILSLLSDLKEFRYRKIPFHILTREGWSD